MGGTAFAVPAGKLQVPDYAVVRLMAGDWLKIEISTPDKPEIWAMAEVLNIDPDAVVGKLFRVWAWFDQHTENCNAPSVTKKLLDNAVRVTGFCDALISVGWLLEEDGKGGTISMPNFERHNGKTAKKRVLSTRRVQKHRKKPRNASSVTKALPDVDVDVDIKEAISSTSGNSNYDAFFKALAAAGFAHGTVHNPKSIPVLSGWIAQGFTPTDVTAVCDLLRARMNGEYPPNNLAYLTPVLADYEPGTVKTVVKKRKRKPEWAIVPRDDGKLEAWARKHKHSPPRRGELAFDYRVRVRADIERRLEKEGA